ncbi:MAG: hypothetical protein WBK08_16890 [Nitrospira sp.]|jgi:hypothetical protein
MTFRPIPSQLKQMNWSGAPFGWDMALRDRKKAVESFRADHQRHTEMVHRTFQSFFVEPKTSSVLKGTLRLIGESK